MTPQALDPVVAARVRRAAPPGHGVLPQSLPVISFGSPATARIATLSLNPSDVEFMVGRNWLEGDKKRLESLHSLGRRSPAELTDADVAAAVRACDQYFQGNWYRQWFGWLEHLIVGANAGSYLDGSACHLDLVQWATRPKQGALPKSVWSALVTQDEGFLRHQLATSSVRAVLVNGRGVVEQLCHFGLVSGWEEGVLRVPDGSSGRLKVYAGTIEGVPTLGWNIPLAQAISAQSRVALADWVGLRLTES